MFDTRKTFSSRIATAIDLTIDFATLGEYGLEEPAKRECESRGSSRGEAWAWGVRGASETSPACGVAWQRHASRATVA
jgi:hypothetical protein